MMGHVDEVDEHASCVLRTTLRTREFEVGHSTKQNVHEHPYTFPMVEFEGQSVIMNLKVGKTTPFGTMKRK